MVNGVPFAFDGEPVRRFDGESFDPQIDGDRLSRQFSQVRAIMLRGAWVTVREIARELNGASDASVSARVRDLRKVRFGGYDIQRRRRRTGADPGTCWEYRSFGRWDHPTAEGCLF
jgi:hypothetical protein